MVSEQLRRIVKAQPNVSKVIKAAEHLRLIERIDELEAEVAKQADTSLGVQLALNEVIKAQQARNTELVAALRTARHHDLCCCGGCQEINEVLDE